MQDSYLSTIFFLTQKNEKPLTRIPEVGDRLHFLARRNYYWVNLCLILLIEEIICLKTMEVGKIRAMSKTV